MKNYPVSLEPLSHESFNSEGETHLVWSSRPGILKRLRHTIVPEPDMKTEIKMTMAVDKAKKGMHFFLEELQNTS